MDELGKTCTNLPLPSSTSFTVFLDRCFLFSPKVLENEKKEIQTSSEKDKIQGSLITFESYDLSS